MAGIERNATSMALGLHCLCIRVAGSSFLFLDERGVIARTSPKKDLKVSDVARWSIYGSYHCNKPPSAYGANLMMMCFTCQEVVDIRLA